LKQAGGGFLSDSTPAYAPEADPWHDAAEIAPIDPFTGAAKPACWWEMLCGDME